MAGRLGCAGWNPADAGAVLKISFPMRVFTMRLRRTLPFAVLATLPALLAGQVSSAAEPPTGSPPTGSPPTDSRPSDTLMAQTPSSPAPTTRSQGTTRQGTHNQTTALGHADERFLKEAASGGMAEVELGRLADKKGQLPDVKAFGRRMVSDHSKADDRLTAIAQQLGVQPPKGLNREQRDLRARLEKTNGAAFDHAYIDAMVTDHQKDIQDFQKEADSGGNAELKQFASSTLPVLREHLQEAQRIQTQLQNRPIESGRN
jgi:putative membrane protein